MANENNLSLFDFKVNTLEHKDLGCYGYIQHIVTILKFMHLMKEEYKWPQQLLQKDY